MTNEQKILNVEEERLQDLLRSIPPVSVTDNWYEHIKSHIKLLDTKCVDTKRRVTNHIYEHLKNSKSYINDLFDIPTITDKQYKDILSQLLGINKIYQEEEL